MTWKAATKHRAKNTLLNVDGEIFQPWRSERIAIPDVTLEQRLLVRIVIGKAAMPVDQINEILESVPVYQTDEPDQAKADSFSCRIKVRDALQELRNRGAVTKLGEWEEIQPKVVEYVDRKREQRRWRGSWKGGPGVPLMDLLERREIVS